MTRIDFVAKHSKQGEAVVIIVPTDFRGFVKNMKNPLRINIEEVFP